MNEYIFNLSLGKSWYKIKRIKESEHISLEQTTTTHPIQ